MNIPKIHIPANLVRHFYKSVFSLRKASPHIFMGAGIIAIVGGTIMACSSARKMDEVVDKNKEAIAILEDKLKIQIEIASDNKLPFDKQAEAASDIPTIKKDLFKARAIAAKDIAFLFAPATGMILLGFGMVIGSHVILYRRNMALAGAYAALNKAYMDYRKRVIEEQGELKDKEIALGLTETEQTVTITNPETGKKEKQKQVLLTANGKPASIYARFFDETSYRYTGTPEYNFMYLLQRQRYWNNELVRRGYIFLNEIYRDLGLRESQVGQFAGWKLNGDGDNEISFGIFDIHSEAHRAFVNGWEPSILLDFNVDGDILHNFSKT